MIIFFKNSAMSNYEKLIFDFQIEGINGEIINLKEYENKVILLVNTASYCGFTKQYDDLQKLWDQYKSRGLIVLGIPSNSFNQEMNNNTEIKLNLMLLVWLEIKFLSPTSPLGSYNDYLRTV